MNGSWPSCVTFDPGVVGLAWGEGRSPLAGDEGEPRRKNLYNVDNSVLWEHKEEMNNVLNYNWITHLIIQ